MSLAAPVAAAYSALIDTPHTTEPTMFSTLSRQATSLALAAMLTLSMLGGVDHLATPAHDTSAQSVNSGTEQVVIITAERLARS